MALAFAVAFMAQVFGPVDHVSAQTPSGERPAPSAPSVEEITSKVGRPLPQPNPDAYRNDVTLGDSIRNFFTVQVPLVLPGAITLFAFSVFFSTINFYTTLPAEQRRFGLTWKYLALWIFTNYSLTMIVLLVVLPDNLKLGSLTRQLLVYCVAVAALPEVILNIRLQLGGSSKALDLYRYKTQLSDLITKQMLRASLQSYNREREYLESYYSEDTQALASRLSGFVRQHEFTDTERAGLLERIRDFKATTSAQLIDAVVIRVALLPSLLDYCREDIRRFRKLPVATLIADLQPRVTIEEATKLVQRGITTRYGFVWRTWFHTRRRALALATGIPEGRVQLLHFSTRRHWARRRLAQTRTVVVLIVFGGLLVVAVNKQANRLFVPYRTSVLADTGAPPDRGPQESPTPGPIK